MVFHNCHLTNNHHFGLIIGIFAVIVIIASILILKLNHSSFNNSNQNSNTVKMGNIQLNLANENEINNSVLYKIGDEYIFKGGDSYTEKGEDGTYHQKYKNLDNLKKFVKFNNNYWRIIKINSDGTIKLVWAGKYKSDTIQNTINLDVKYVETKTNNFNYENSYIRNYLNITFLSDTSIIPSNYADYLVKSSWGISTYSASIYDIYSYKNSEN